MGTSPLKNMLLGWTWVPHNSACLIINDSNGAWRVESGPITVYLFRQTAWHLSKTVALEEEYLMVEYLDGKKEHIAGPAVFHHNHLLHRQVVARRKLQLATGYSSVLFQKSLSDPSKIARHVLEGPIQYIPQVGEWSHQFSWLIPDPQSENPTSRSQPISFYKLRTVPDQMRFTVTGVRTQDDALLDIKFMIFYQLEDIDKMLNATHDPTGDSCSTLTADVMEFTSQRTFEKFKYDCEQLNLLQTFSQLSTRMSAIGYKTLKVAYLGYEAGARLQSMHNNSIEERTRLQLQSETELQEQDLEDTKQNRQLDREMKQLQMQRDRQAFEDETRQKQTDADILRKQAVFESELEQKVQAANQAEREKRKLVELELERETKSNQAAADMQRVQLGNIAELAAKTQLDVTAYLVAQARLPVDQRIEILGQGSPSLHLHDIVNTRSRL